MELATVLSLVTRLFGNTTEFGIAQRAKLAALLTERPTVSGTIRRLIAIPKSEGGYDYASPNITDANFPATTEPSLEGVQLDKIVGPRRHVFAVLKSKGRRASNGAETLLYGQKNPGEQEKYWIWGLGQVWVDPDDCCERAVVLGMDVIGERCALLCGVVVDVHARERVLSFPMTEAELAARDARGAAGRSD